MNLWFGLSQFTSCFQFCPWQVCLLPTGNHTFSFSGLCKVSNIGVLFLLKPILSCSVTPKTDSTLKKIKILCQLYRNSQVMIRKVRGSFLKVTKFQGEEAAASWKLFCVTSALSLPEKGESWSSARRGQAVEALPGQAPVTYLSFSY